MHSAAIAVHAFPKRSDVVFTSRGGGGALSLSEELVQAYAQRGHHREVACAYQSLASADPALAVNRMRTSRRDVHDERHVASERACDADFLARDRRHDRAVRITESDLRSAGRPGTAHGKNLGLSRGRIRVRPGVREGQRPVHSLSREHSCERAHTPQACPSTRQTGGAR
jgi:hypothetical protein